MRTEAKRGRKPDDWRQCGKERAGAGPSRARRMKGDGMENPRRGRDDRETDARRILQLEKRMAVLEEWREESWRFHKQVYQWQQDASVREARMDEQRIYMTKNTEKLMAQQEERQAKLGKRAETILDKALWAVIAALIGALLSRIGL